MQGRWTKRIIHYSRVDWLPLCILGERNWREDEWRGEFDQSDSILFVCQRRENFSSATRSLFTFPTNSTLNFPPLTGTHDATRKANLPWAVHQVVRLDYFFPVISNIAHQGLQKLNLRKREIFITSSNWRWRLCGCINFVICCGTLYSCSCACVVCFNSKLFLWTKAVLL